MARYDVYANPVVADSSARMTVVLAPGQAYKLIAKNATTITKRLAAEKRATFRCTPGLLRPQALIAPGLVAAGDYVQGPYPATLEGAVRAGEAAVALLLTRAA